MKAPVHIALASVAAVLIVSLSNNKINSESGSVFITPGCVVKEQAHVNCTDLHGFTSAAVPYGTVGKTLGDPVYDRKLREEVSNQRDFFQGVKAEVLILDEKMYELRNAYATKDGKIYFGKNMFFYTIRNYNELAVAGILAHEWGHRVQYTFGWEKEMHNPVTELEADAMSGFYMALEKGFAWSHIHGYFASTLNTGDYDVNSPNHHGTPNQRVAAAYLGVQLALEAVENQKAFSYEDLHERIIDSIEVNILREAVKTASADTLNGSKLREIAAGKTSGKEIEIPVLSAEERRKYYPHSN